MKKLAEKLVTENYKQGVITTYMIDLFCGAGGVTLGVSESKTNVKVIACINHDEKAILSHLKNHPNCLHYIEDIRTIDLSPLTELVQWLRILDPTCKIAVWASLECTNFSKAKCGPKDADSRSLADDMFRYMEAFNPDFFWVENVEEFKDWGPLDKNNNPDKSKLGQFYRQWVKELGDKHFQPHFYEDVLIASNYGARTIRKRLFLQFAKDARHIGVPVQTHSKDGSIGEHWLPVKDVLNLENHGKSIFTRKKLLVWKTHRRIFKGLVKYGHEQGTHYGYKYYGQLGFQDINDPCCTLTTKDRLYLMNIKPVAIKMDYGTSDARSINMPAQTLTTSPKGDVIFTKSISFVHNPQYGGSNRSIEAPACTIIARQDKAPLGLTSALSHELKCTLQKFDNPEGRPHIEFDGTNVIYNIFGTDDEWLIQIKEYMYKNQILDIKVRPLEIPEMLQIQGFPKDYTLYGTQEDQKKFIGNSVEKFVGIALIRSIDKAIQNPSTPYITHSQLEIFN